MGETGISSQVFVSYEESVHGRAVASGSQKAAVCTDCHGVHEILSAADPKSSIFKFNVPATCGKCHQQVQYEFTVSIHGQAIARANSQAPVCTDCHGIHTIKSHIDPNSSVSAQNLARSTCARCHEGVRLSREFGLPGGRVTSYLESYHGLASELGSQVVANCASCHGAHYILPSSDPRSTINRANLVHTCGQCHPGVTEKFVVGKVHVEVPLSADTGSKAVRWVRKIYVSLIVVVIGGMVLHNLMIWRRKAILRRKQEHRLVTRMTVNQRCQHILLFSSFIVLVLTGFALKYPTSWFAELLGLREHLRAIIHRVAGVVLIATSLYHFVYVLVTRDGRRLLRDFIPVPKDATDVVETLAYYLGLKSHKPEFGRFTYAEKAEYWALVWGVFVMAGTGIMLWARVFFGDLLPRWWLDVATAIHFYEAVLATLAILVWHFYQVFLDPDIYPMNWAWWDGKMSFEHYREEHGLDGATLLEAERGDVSEPADTGSSGHDTNGNGNRAAGEPVEPEPVDTRK
jgi:cytochrome b subunit of formate dehydrogenase